jgi:hypothetical protein
MGTMRLSDIVREDRIDAGFHLAAQEHAATVASLREKLTGDEARDVVLGLPDAVLTKRLEGRPVLEPLVRGSTPGTTLRQIRKAVEEYPHLSLAILSPHLDEAIASAQSDIDDIQKSIASIRDVARIGAKKETS